jgi:hypothetical protein
MIDFSSVPDFDGIAILIKEKVDAMRMPACQWADLARLAVQGLPHDTHRRIELEARINAIRSELRGLVLVASEHFSEDRLNLLRKQVGMSKAAWRSAKNKRAVTIKHGFSLVIY